MRNHPRRGAITLSRISIKRVVTVSKEKCSSAHRRDSPGSPHRPSALPQAQFAQRPSQTSPDDRLSGECLANTNNLRFHSCAPQSPEVHKPEPPQQTIQSLLRHLAGQARHELAAARALPAAELTSSKSSRSRNGNASIIFSYPGINPMPPTIVNRRSMPSRIASAEPSRKRSSRLRGTIRPSQQMRRPACALSPFAAQLCAFTVSALRSGVSR